MKSNQTLGLMVLLSFHFLSLFIVFVVWQGSGGRWNVINIDLGA